MKSSVTRMELAKIIGEKSIDISDSAKLTRSVAAYLAEQKKPVDLQSLMRDVMQYRLEKGYVEATITSAHELTNEVIDDIRSLLKDHFPNEKRTVLNYKIDETLVGGVRIELPRETLDLSIRNKLNRFKRLVAEERN